MDHADGERLDSKYWFAQDEEVAMGFFADAVSCGGFVTAVDVDVWFFAVAMVVDVQVAPHDVPCGAEAEVYQHDPDPKLEVRGDGFVPAEGGLVG